MPNAYSIYTLAILLMKKMQGGMKGDREIWKIVHTSVKILATTPVLEYF